MKKFSGKSLSELINKYRKEFNPSSKDKVVNSGSGIQKGKLREETVEMLKHSLSQTSSKLQQLGKIKTSSDGTKYISFM